MSPIDPRWLKTAERVRTHCYPTMAAPHFDTSISVAHHEGAHAVLLERTGRRVNCATIEADVAGGDAAGRVWAGARYPGPGREYPLAPDPLTAAVFPDARPLVCLWAAASFAGRQAELLLAGIKTAGNCLCEYNPDDLEARYLLSTAFGPIRGTVPMSGAQALARIMLCEFWSEVQAVAGALLDLGTLSGDQIREAMNRGCAAAARSDPPSRRAPPDALRVEPLLASGRADGWRRCHPQDRRGVFRPCYLGDSSLSPGRARRVPGQIHLTVRRSA